MGRQTNKALVPKLRFPEFQDAEEWEENTIANICKIYSGGTPATSQKEFYGGNIPFIRSAEINKEYTELFLTKKGFEKSSAKLVKKGAILVALYGANSGEIALAKQEGAINQAILCMESNASNSFIYQFLSSKKNWVVSTYIQGGQGNLSGEIIKSIKLFIPLLKEQQKIAACLSSIDALITTQSQKVEALKTHKKGFMQQLFPTEGKTLPKLRFSEFQDAGEWEEKLLGDIAKSENSQLAKNKLEFLKDGYPVYGADGLIGNTSSYTQNEDYIAVIKDGAGVGKLFFYKKKSSILGTLTHLKTKDDNFQCLAWLFYFLQTVNFSKYIKGSGIPHIYFTDYTNEPVLIPSLKEQQKIAACLSSIDELITAQSQKVDALKAHKKGLMQQLFPSVDEEGA